MKARICSEERSFSVLLPTRMVFSRGFLKFGLRIGRMYSDAVPQIPPEAVDALCCEIRRIKKSIRILGTGGYPVCRWGTGEGHSVKAGAAGLLLCAV